MRNKKIKKLNEIIRIAVNAKRRGRKVVTTNGCFDIIHAGHVEYLKHAEALGDILIVGVNSDASVRKNKGPLRPINSERDRAEVLAGLESVDYVFIFREETPISWLKKIRPNAHVKGADRSREEIIERHVLKEMDAHLVLAPYHKGKSTTNIIERIIKAYQRDQATGWTVRGKKPLRK